jgi:hypothetical protein
MRMTLERTLLEKLAKWRFPSGRQTLDADEAGVKVRATADCADEVGCRLWDVSLTRPAPAEPLEDRARRLASRATGLLEPLRLLELDAVRQVALLRSDRPARRDEQLDYYEVQLGGDGSANVRRFRASPQGGEKRQQIHFTLTHEALAKLAGDLDAC